MRNLGFHPTAPVNLNSPRAPVDAHESCVLTQDVKIGGR